MSVSWGNWTKAVITVRKEKIKQKGRSVKRKEREEERKKCLKRGGGEPGREGGWRKEKDRHIQMTSLART